MTLKIKKVLKMTFKEEKETIETIIKNIEDKKYHSAYLKINYGINRNSSWLYKDLDQIARDQTANLFYDIENNTNLTLEFFKRQLSKIEAEITRQKRFIAQYEDYIAYEIYLGRL